MAFLIDILTGEDQTVLERWNTRNLERPGWPGHWMLADWDRSIAIAQAELVRLDVHLALMDAIYAAHLQGCPNTPDAVRREMSLREFHACARRAMPDMDDRIAAVPRVDRAGMMWEIREYERSQREGTLVPRLPTRRSDEEGTA